LLPRQFCHRSPVRGRCIGSSRSPVTHPMQRTLVRRPLAPACPRRVSPSRSAKPALVCRTRCEHRCSRTRFRAAHQ
jgi:hypothetical protein